MRMGIPYDSDRGRALAGALAAIMTGAAYRQSAKIAGTKIGPFAKFEENREPFIEVMNKHRRAVGKIEHEEGLESLLSRAQDIWDDVIKLGVEHGYRNAQATVLAPTGTIGLLMDVDTTGIEPDYSLKKFKTLAGGGSTEIVNEGVYFGLEHLGYSSEQIAEIRNYVDKNMLIEGAPHLKEEHLPVFDTANKNGSGERHISPMGHVKMVAAVQPFISGAISKTVNLPESATVADIRDIYIKGWEMGAKALAVYRDRSKVSQVLNSSKITGIERRLKWGERKSPPSTREGMTRKVTIGEQTLIVRTGEYLDGSLAEIFLDSSKEGSTQKSYMQSFAVSLSFSLQYGMPVEKMVNQFQHVQADPRGVVTGDPNIKMAQSPADYIARMVGLEYLGDSSFASDPTNVDENALRVNILARRRKLEEKFGDELNGKSNNGDRKKKGKNKESIQGTCGKCGGVLVRSGTCLTCRKCGDAGGCG
jgi:ribonucleoside-diphosphate reductase alpha chain